MLSSVKMRLAQCAVVIRVLVGRLDIDVQGCRYESTSHWEAQGDIMSNPNG